MKTLDKGRIHRTYRPKKADGEKTYYILINGKRKYFGSQRDANLYLNQVKRQMNHMLTAANLFYGDLFKMYREQWFYFSDPAGRANYRSFQAQIRKSFRELEILLDRATQPYNPVLGMAGAEYMEQCLEQLQRIVLLMKMFYQKKGLHAARKTLLFMEHQIQMMVDEVANLST